MDMTILLVIAGAGIIIGLLLGLMINALRGDSSKRTEEPAPTARGIDNILLWHDQEGGNLFVDLDGSTFTRLSEMRTDQRSRLETCYSQLKRFLGVQDTGPRPTMAIPRVEQPEPEVFIAPEPVKPIPAKINLGALVVPAAAVDKKGGKAPAPEPIKPLSIVGEIDEILQNMIEGTPLLERGLQLVETPNHTIAVWIDKHQFENIDAVTDPEVQQVIHAAVKKWEDKPI
jgi:hypothetical protein